MQTEREIRYEQMSQRKRINQQTCDRTMRANNRSTCAFSEVDRSGFSKKDISCEVRMEISNVTQKKKVSSVRPTVRPVIYYF